MSLYERKVEIFKKWKSGKSLNYIRKKYGEYGIFLINIFKENARKNHILYECDLDSKSGLIAKPVLSERKKQILHEFTRNKKSINQINKKYGDYGVFTINLYKEKCGWTCLF